jgi:hypothetical protein
MGQRSDQHEVRLRVAAGYKRARHKAAEARSDKRVGLPEVSQLLTAVFEDRVDDAIEVILRRCGQRDHPGIREQRAEAGELEGVASQPGQQQRPPEDHGLRTRTEPAEPGPPGAPAYRFPFAYSSENPS